MPDWGEFSQDRGGAPPPQHDADFDSICAMALSGPAGRSLIEALRARFIEAAENVNAPEAALRVRATRAQFVRDLIAAAERGNAAAKVRSQRAVTANGGTTGKTAE